MITLSQTYTQTSVPRTIPGTSATARFRALAHRIRSISESLETPLTTVGLTSCARGEGVSAMAANLAIAAAETTTRPVLLIDLNVAHPGQGAIFGMSGNLGLRDALTASAPLADCPKATPIVNLSLLAPSAAYELDSSAVDPTSIRDLLEFYQHDFELIILDLPPATEASAAVATATNLSGVLLVVEAEHTRCEAANRAVARLIDARANVLGAVLNKRPEHIPDWLYKRL